MLKLGHLRKRDQKYLVSFEMWCWSGMLDRTCKNKEVQSNAVKNVKKGSEYFVSL